VAKVACINALEQAHALGYQRYELIVFHCYTSGFDSTMLPTRQASMHRSGGPDFGGCIAPAGECTSQVLQQYLIDQPDRPTPVENFRFAKTAYSPATVGTLAVEKRR
jgi:hypothetical protein